MKKGRMNVKRIRYIVLCVMVLVCSGILFSGAGYTSPVEVKCTNGVFKGVPEKETGVLSFKGIPYAKPPVGERRWKAPVEPELSNEHFDATEFGKACLQSESTEEVWGKPMGEDCLSLNIWTSDIETGNKPVMVWIHGGSYGWGGTNDKTYDGEYLVSKYGDLIVVTINYRVNLMGFIDFSNIPGGEDFPDAPYLGILDQKMALRWVRKNIAAFGGDPDNVTIFGESAGGGSVVSQLASNGSEKLFKKAIVQSGAGLNHSKAKYDDKNQAGELLKAAGVSDMAGLMALSEEELFKAMNVKTEIVGDENGSRVTDLNNFPMRDDKLSIIPFDVSKAIVERSGDVDVMIGTTGDEMRYWVDEMGVANDTEVINDDRNIRVFYDFIRGKFDAYKNRFPSEAEKINKALRISHAFDDSKYAKMYPGIWQYTDIASEVSFRTPTLKIVDDRIKAGGKGKTYVYLFNKRATNREWVGACHACELSYVFYNLVHSSFGDTDPGLAADVSAAWVAFARTGNPSTEKIYWPEYNLDTRPTMVMGNDCTMKAVNDPEGEMRELLKNVLIF